MERPLHVIFGAGQVGSTLARELLERGDRVRIFKRSERGVPAGAELSQGDASDRQACIAAASGASVVYHCMNPPYFANLWAEFVPRWMQNLIDAAGSAGARFVVLDNVYALGRPGGRPLSDDTPVNPCSRKGEIRAEAARMLFDAHGRGDVVAVVGRGSDFYGPHGTESHVGDQFWRPVMAGKRGGVVVDPDAVHTYHYIPDVARGLLTLGGAPESACGQAWMLPCQPAETLRQLVGRFSTVLGREISIRSIPRWMLKALGIVMPLMRELDEMMYQWEEPFVIDDGRFRTQFSVMPEDRDRAARETVAWAREHYAGDRR